MSVGTQAVQKSGGAWLASLAFCVVYLVCLFQGVGPEATLIRAIVAAFVAYLAGRLLMAPLSGVIYDAIAAHEQEMKEAARLKEEGKGKAEA